MLEFCKPKAYNASVDDSACSEGHFRKMEASVGTMQPITIKVAEGTLNSAKEKAKRFGYFSVEEYLGAMLEDDANLEVPMTLELAVALEEGLADRRAGRVISLEELDRRHAEQRLSWMRARES